MNKFNQNFFQVLYPFYPFWAWFCYQFLHFPPEKILIFMLVPSVLYTVWTMHIRFPAYLAFYTLFTLFHLWTVFYNDLLPDNTNWFFYIFSDCYGHLFPAAIQIQVVSFINCKLCFLLCLYTGLYFYSFLHHRHRLFRRSFYFRSRRQKEKMVADCQPGFQYRCSGIL